jgi:prepilin-type N-terminal cleavage/methylation domain-containing protein
LTTIGVKKIIHRNGTQAFNQQGFTLIELLSVMVIMSVLASVTVQRFELLSDTTTHQALKAAISELDIRETLTWTNMKLSVDGWTKDADVFAELNTNLGADYYWDPEASISGGRLHFRTESVDLVRSPSTQLSSGHWQPTSSF